MAEVQIANEGTVNELLAMRTTVEPKGRPVMGCDIQDDRIEVSVVQDGGDGRMEVLAHHLLDGETHDENAGGQLVAVRRNLLDCRASGGFRKNT